MSSTEQKLDWFSHNSSPSFVCLVDQQEVGMDILNLFDYPSDRFKYKQAAKWRLDDNHNGSIWKKAILLECAILHVSLRQDLK